MSELFEQTEFPINAVYNARIEGAKAKCGGEADVGQEKNGGVKCGGVAKGTIHDVEINTPKYKLQGCAEISVTTDPKSEPSKFWNWAINGMKGCIASLNFGVQNGVPITSDTLNKIKQQSNELLELTLRAKDQEHNTKEIDLDSKRFWKWSAFGLLSCLNFVKFGIESETSIPKEQLSSIKTQYLRLGQYIEALEDSIEEPSEQMDTMAF